MNERTNKLEMTAKGEEEQEKVNKECRKGVAGAGVQLFPMETTSLDEGKVEAAPTILPKLLRFSFDFVMAVILVILVVVIGLVVASLAAEQHHSNSCGGQCDNVL